MPAIITSLPHARATRAWLLTDEHGDVDDIVLGINGLSPCATFVFQVHRYLGRVTDAFVIDRSVEKLRAPSSRCTVETV